ncbi:MAG TPA: chemotaxis protein CheW [Candidatus Binatia bacterium]|nr:chemotaxis protein CheW [Candidatus Binatia bacterium]
MDDLTKDFLVESYENLDRMDRDFVELEKNPSKEILDSIFRSIHTIKGTCGFLGFGKLELITHAGENLLSLLRDGTLQVNRSVTDALLALVDAVRDMLSSIEATENEGERDDSALIERLQALQRGASPRQDGPSNGSQLGSVQLSGKKASPMDPVRFGEMLVQSGRVSEEQVARALQAQAGGDPRRLGEILVQQGAVDPATVLQTIQSQSEARAAVADSTLRVDVGALDRLMNLVGELVLARNQIMQFAAGQEDSALFATSQHLSLITSELQEGIMKTRMQPIGNVWHKFPRMVRDLAASCNKSIRVEMAGAETELDRTIIDAIKDPLTHVLRNSVDHGIETPEVRTAAGKPAEGCLSLRAFHEGGQVNIEISDDGAGIDAEALREKALHKGLISAEHAAGMNDRELLNLVFLPGFSTAEKVSNISGRGVGMDVVKANIEKIGGTVDVQSDLGHGTTIRLKIPLTLAIIPALMVTSGGERFAIPQASLLELIRLEGDQGQTAIEMVYGAPVYRLRGKLLPLVFLSRELKLGGRSRADDPSSLYIVVLQAERRQFGIVVDGIDDAKDIVVKPLGKQLRGLSIFSGATVLGDGKVALILDVNGIFQNLNVVSEARNAIGEISVAEHISDESQTFLICRHGGKRGEQVAIPLSLVARLEHFRIADIERSAQGEVVQYRGEIMPLVRLSNALGSMSEREDGGNVQVVVYREHGRSVGLVVDHVADIVEERVPISDERHGGHFSTRLVLQGCVTDVLDVRAVIKALNPGCLVQAAVA